MDYESNSHKSKADSNEPLLLPEGKKIDKVVTGPVKTKKKNEIRKFAEVFLAEDINSIKSWILLDVVVPEIQKAIMNVVKNGVEILLYGRNGSSRRESQASKISYWSRYEKNEDRRRDYESPRTRSGYSYEDVVLDSKAEANSVLDRMNEIIETYGIVSVADYYDLLGVTGRYTDNDYGWTDIRSSSVVRVRDGWMIRLPKALPIN